MSPPFPPSEPSEDAPPLGADGRSSAVASTLLLALRERLEDRSGKVSLGEVIDGMGQASLGLTLLLLLTLPSMIPIPGPFGMVFGSIIALLSLQIMLGATRLKLPGFVRRLMLPVQGVGRLLDRGAPYLKRAESWLKPRRLLALTGRTGRVVLAFPLLLSAITLALPIPGGNVLPAASLVAFGLGLMTRDGAAVLAGLGLSIAGAIWGTLVVVTGAEAIGWIGSLFA